MHRTSLPSLLPTGEWAEGRGEKRESKTNVKCVFRTTETDLKKKRKKLSLKSKLASGPHESKKDLQEQSREENDWQRGRPACGPVVRI